MKSLFKVSTLAAVALALTAGLTSVTSAQAQAPDTLSQIKPNDAMLAKGAELFKANGCNGCHGDQGKGDGAGGAALNPKPRNFHAKEGWKNGQSFAGLYKTLEEGLPGTPMGSFSHLPATERVAIINHIRSLAKANYPEPTAADVETLNKSYNLTEQLARGASQVIPVDKAIELLIAEAEPQQAKVKAALAKFEASHDAALDGVANPERALTMLVNAGNSWKGSAQDFTKMVIYDPGTSGFKSLTGNYTPAQWSQLQAALKKLL